MKIILFNKFALINLLIITFVVFAKAIKSKITIAS
jgi:hypothetical protein